jgi:hypothetical protein
MGLARHYLGRDHFGELRLHPNEEALLRHYFSVLELLRSETENTINIAIAELVDFLALPITEIPIEDVADNIISYLMEMQAEDLVQILSPNVAVRDVDLLLDLVLTLHDIHEIAGREMIEVQEHLRTYISDMITLGTVHFL